MIKALSYLHNKRIVHWDMHIGNLLLSFPKHQTSDITKICILLQSSDVSDDESNKMYLRAVLIDFGMSKISVDEEDSI